MKNVWMLIGVLVVSLSWSAIATERPVIYVHWGDAVYELPLDDAVLEHGTVAYQGPMNEDGSQNWKSPRMYGGIPVATILEAYGTLDAGDTVAVVGSDGWYKTLPDNVLQGNTDAGTPMLALERDGESWEDWEDAPVLILLPEDETFGNEDMLASFGPDFSHYFGDKPSTTGMMVKGVRHLVVNYDGRTLELTPAPTDHQDAAMAPDVVLTVVQGVSTLQYSLEALEAFEALTAEGTFTTSTNTDYSATYTGVSLLALLGNIPADATVRITASDGYSMNYPAELLADTAEGVWILAYKENGEFMPYDPGYLRVVMIGEHNPHFSSSLSAKMVERIEVLGTYEEYSLQVVGAVERTFRRGELEAGVGCPCHTATVQVTSKGETSEFSGLPLWRLLAFVDDQAFPAADKGIYYEDADFNDQLAATPYTISLIASDGYTQTVTSDLIARDDRFIVAFKRDGVFLDAASDGYMRFVYDDAVELPDDVRLKSVKFLVEIRLDL